MKDEVAESHRNFFSHSNNITNKQLLLLEDIFESYNISNKKNFIFLEDCKGNWIFYSYYISGLIFTRYPEYLLPYLYWKIANIKQRV